MFTPFKDGKVDVDALVATTKRQVEAGIDFLVPLGTTGETPTLSDEEKLLVFHTVKAHAAGKPVVVGVGTNSLAGTRANMELLKEADAYLVVVPYYNKPPQRGIYAYFKAVAESTDKPIILYNVPGRTGLSFTPETYQVLSRHPNINGVKEASGDFGLITRTLALCGEDWNLWSGDDGQTVPMLALGARGLISVASNLIPRGMTELTHSWLRGDVDKARELQLRYTPLFDALFAQVNPIPIKAALEEAGLDSGVLRLPLVRMDHGARKELKELLDGLEELKED